MVTRHNRDRISDANNAPWTVETVESFRVLDARSRDNARWVAGDKFVNAAVDRAPIRPRVENLRNSVGRIESE